MIDAARIVLQDVGRCLVGGLHMTVRTGNRSWEILRVSVMEVGRCDICPAVGVIRGAVAVRPAVAAVAGEGAGSRPPLGGAGHGYIYHGIPVTVRVAVDVRTATFQRNIAG